MSEKNIYKNRLLLLASFLEALPNDRFNFGSWVGSDWKGKSDLSCGTTACALGWATTIPQLADAGLTLIVGEEGYGQVCLRQNVNEVIEKELGLLYTAQVAGEEVFDLSLNEFQYLFIPGENLFDSDDRMVTSLSQGPTHMATPERVAKHIRDFVQYKYPE